MLEITVAILQSAWWFVLGCVLYYILSALKVHLIWYIQPRLYSTDPDRMFDGYFHSLRNAFTDRAQHLNKATLKYLFKYDPKKFLIDQSDLSKALRKRINVLEGMTVFLKPYLIFAFLWIIIKTWISLELAYDETQLTLGELQKLLTWLDGFPLVKFLQDFKYWIILFYGIICIAIPFLYDKEKATDDYKRQFTSLLVYLSLIANISFFGAKTGGVVKVENAKLVALDAQVTKIHNSIYKEVFIYVAREELEDTVRISDSRYEEVISEMESESELKPPHIVPPFDRQFSTDAGTYFSYLRTNTLFSDLDFDALSNKSWNSTSTPSAIFERIDNEMGSYFSNKDMWSIKTGEEVLNNFKTAVASNPLKTGEVGKKLERLLGILFDFGLDNSFDAVFETFRLPEQSTLRELVGQVFSENFKAKVVEKTRSILNKFKLNQSPPVLVATAKIKPSQIQPSIAKLTEFKEYNMAKIVEKQNVYLENSLKNRISKMSIELPDEAEIIKRVQDAYKESNIPVDFFNGRETIEALNNSGALKNYKFDESISLAENIKRMDMKAYFDVFKAQNNGINVFEYNNSLRSYNVLLSKGTSNISIMRYVGASMSLVICPRCGLPRAFPVCLPIL